MYLNLAYQLILYAPIPQNGQTQSKCVFGHFVGLSLKGLTPNWSNHLKINKLNKFFIIFKYRQYQTQIIIQY